MQLSFEQMVAQMDAPPAIAAEEVDEAGNGRMTNPAAILQFVLGGNARFTLRSAKTGERFTYRVRASEDGNVHFVSLLSGPDNETAYSYFGYIRRGVYFHGGAKARVGAEAPSAKGFAWFYRHVCAAGTQPASDRTMPANLEFWHEGRCGRCGRALTVPESVRTGFGPECAGRLGL